MRVETFEPTRAHMLGGSINTFLKNRPDITVIDIKYTSGTDAKGRLVYSALIMYEQKTP